MKRLRENAFMEAEISGDGTVVVEGHTVGELQGFRFTLDGKAEGQDGKAVRAASQKALAGEFEKRAERFANAPNGDIALGSDGLIRWLGAPVASLAASDDPLKPKVVLFADEQLSGPERDKVAARAERSVTYQVSTVLKPLVDLKTAEGLEGTAKGLAFRLSENLGMVQRRDVAEEVRSLDQDARAALRRCGVRFGAYHIFIPALIKPAPAALLTLLWAVNKDGRERPGYGEVTHLLATGRTSAVADPAIDPVFFGLAGYRLLGRRAVRVDILERLADLIRPALAWKPGTGKRPEGGYNGAQFLVTPAMMSILGATAEDMEEVLKGLGYRADGIEAGTVEAEIQRLDAEIKTAEAASRAEAERKAAEAVATLETPQPQDESGDAPATSEAAGEPAEEQPAAESSDGSTAETVVPVMAVASEEVAEGEPAASMADPVAVTDETPAATSSVESPVAETAPDETVVGEPASESDGEPTAPKLVQVWRPQRAGGRAGHRQGQRGKGRETGGGAAAPERGQRFGKGDQKSDGGTENERQAKGRPNRDWKERGERKEGGGGRRFDKPQTSYNKPVQARPQRVDPDSPFAKLAALKDKLGK